MYDVTTAKLFLLDMDGTFYLDDTLLPGALEFLALCRATGRQFAFLTNNSSKSKADYLAKLTRLGADVTEHDIFTSGDATLLYLAENGFPKDILLIGTPSLEAQFAAEGYTVRAAKPRAVVLGFACLCNTSYIPHFRIKEQVLVIVALIHKQPVYTQLLNSHDIILTALVI